MPDFTVDKPFFAYDYYIFFDGSRIKARNGKTGLIQFTDIGSAGHADVVIQACLDALSAGGTIYIGVGTFNLYAQVASSNNVNIIGSGRGKTILKRNIAASSDTISLSGSNITISSLTIHGNNPTNASCLGAELTLTGSNVLVSDIEGTAWTTFFIVNTGSVTFSNSIIHDATNTTSAVNGASALWSATTGAITTFSNCRIYNLWGGAGFFGGITTYKDCYIGNTTQTLGGGQIAAGADGTSRIINCVIEPDAGNGGGIEITDGNFIIVGNRIRGQTLSGISIQGAAAGRPGPTIVANNIVSNCHQYGITAYPFSAPDSRFIITNNICYDDQGTHTQLWGISIEDLAPGTNNYIVTGNMCYGNLNGQLRDLGTGTNKIVANNLTA